MGGAGVPESYDCPEGPPILPDIVNRVDLRSGVRAAAAFCWLVASAALAQDAAVSAAPGDEVLNPYDMFQARLRYGVAVRSGAQTDQGPGLTYSGLTPNDLALQGWGWFLLDGKLGGTLALQREGFALYDRGTKVTSGGLLRFSLGPAGRLALGPVRLEASAGYALQQLPFLGSSSAPSLAPVTRHAVLLAARGIVDLGRVELEAHAEVPIALATTAATAATSSSGFGVGGGIRVNLFDVGFLRWGVLADVGYVSDTLSDSSGLKGSQSVVRAGGAVDLKWREGHSSGPRFGGLLVEVVDAASGAPLPGVEVGVGARTATTGADGKAHLSGLDPGRVSGTASAGGYLRGQLDAEVSADEELPLTVKLEREPPRVGGLKLTAVGQDGKGLPGVAFEVADQKVTSAEGGTALVSGLPPGPVGVKARLDGYQPAEETAAVVAGKDSAVSLTLVPLKKSVPATLTGIVRSTAGGAPVAADLEVRELRLKAKASAQGSFSFQVPGGTYTVTISAPGFLAQTKSVTVKDGDQAIFNVDLHPR